jgi:dipeptidyl-peptidase 4
MSRRLTLADVTRQPAPGLDHPGSPAFSPDGSAITYLQSADGSLVRSLWWHEITSGSRTELLGPEGSAIDEEALSHEERLRRERTRTSELGVTEYAWSSAAGSATLLVPRSGAALAAIGRTLPRLRSVRDVEQTSRTLLSPDGRRLAFVRDGDLWVVDLPDGTPRRLTFDAEPGVRNGLADYAASEELDRHDGMWWSADGSAIACARVDERAVPPFVIAHLASEERGSETHRYPFAGGPNAIVQLRVIAVADGRTVEARLPMEPDDYLARVAVRPRGGWLVAVLPRHQRALRWSWLDVDGAVRPAWEETSEPWINLDVDARVLSDGRVLRTTEATSFRHIELRAPDGSLERRLTGGDWMVTGVRHVDEPSGAVLFMGTRDGVTERHLYSVPLDADIPVVDPERLTDEPGWHEVTVSADGSAWVDTWSSLQHPPVVAVRGRDGTRLATLHESDLRAEGLGITVPELTTVTAADGASELQVAVYRARRPAGGPPPGVLAVYGGPHVQQVANAWSLTVLMLRQYLREAGATVLVVDNRGSANRGLAFEAAIDRALGSVEVEDQAAAVRQLAERSEIDPSRVAVTGGSYGGYMTLRCMARHPDLFRAGVALAPVTDWDGYDTAYTERYMGTPSDEAVAYAASSALTDAGSIVGRLLLIHGELDENVHLRHSVRMLAALHAAGRSAELVVLPGQRHRTRGAAALALRDGRLLEHVLRELGLAADR